jgi:hypothetical protein
MVILDWSITYCDITLESRIRKSLSSMNVSNEDQNLKKTYLVLYVA